MQWVNPAKRFGCYINPYIEDTKHNLWDVILWRFGHYDEPHTLPPSDFRYPAESRPCNPELPTAVWIGHSTYWLKVGGLSILTDPLFSDHCSPIPVRALKRFHQPAIALEEIPSVDVVLISHNHYDHLDEKSVDRINKKFPLVQWVVPIGVKRWFIKKKMTNVSELNWGDTVSFWDRCKVTAVPAQHFSGRGIWDENRSLWCGFVFECHQKIFYFVGDSGYNPVDFKSIGERWPVIDLSMIPIGAYAPKRLLRGIHVCPSEAVQIHSDVKSRLSLGMHWNTFNLSDEPVELPPYDLFLAMKESKIPFESFLPSQMGVPINW